VGTDGADKSGGLEDRSHAFRGMDAGQKPSPGLRSAGVDQVRAAHPKSALADSRLSLRKKAAG